MIEVLESEEFRVVFELDEFGEATGTVHPFCSAHCREAYGHTSHTADGINSVDDFGFVPQCEWCGSFVCEC